MERESDAEAMQRIKVFRVSGDPIAPPLTPEYPSKFRFYWGAIGLGFATGITWTAFALSPPVQRHITRTTALASLYGIAVIIFISQLWMLCRWKKQITELDRHDAEKAKLWNDIFERQVAERIEEWETFKKEVEKENEN